MASSVVSLAASFASRLDYSSNSHPPSSVPFQSLPELSLTTPHGRLMLTILAPGREENAPRNAACDFGRSPEAHPTSTAREVAHKKSHAQSPASRARMD